MQHSTSLICRNGVAVGCGFCIHSQVARSPKQNDRAQSQGSLAIVSPHAHGESAIVRLGADKLVLLVAEKGAPSLGHSGSKTVMMSYCLPRRKPPMSQGKKTGGWPLRTRGLGVKLTLYLLAPLCCHSCSGGLFIRRSSIYVGPFARSAQASKPTSPVHVAKAKSTAPMLNHPALRPGTSLGHQGTQNWLSNMWRTCFRLPLEVNVIFRGS